MTGDQRPHSRACGWAAHYHGTQCSPDCPTCSRMVAREKAIELGESERQHRAWIAAAEVSRWGQDPTTDTLAAARAAVAALAPWLTEEDQP